MGGTTGAPARERRALITDAYDDLTYADARQRFGELDKQNDAARERLRTAGDLLADLFGSFHQRAPVLRDPAHVAESHRLNREIMGEIAGTQEWRDLRMSGTVGSPLASALATIGTVEQALAAVPESDRDAANAAADADAKMREHLARAGALDALAHADPAQAAEYRKRAERNRREAARLAARRAELLAALDAGQDARADAVRRAARGALGAAAGTVAATLGGIGMLGGGDAEALPLDEQLALAETLRASPKLLELAAICGRFERLALHAQRGKVDYAPSEIASVHAGDDLARLLPAETALLGDPELEELWYLRYAERKLAQYELVAHEPVGKGPIIVAGDESASMTAELGGAGYTRELWCKAATLALAGVARKERRDFAYIGFSGGAPVYVEHIPAGDDEPPAPALIRIAEHFDGGGTEYEHWMRAAAELIAASRFERADVIVLSDGEAHVGDALLAAWRKLRQERGTRCYAVLLADAGDTYQASVLAALADQHFTIRELADDAGALRHIFAV